jgi:hypothetical protein
VVAPESGALQLVHDRCQAMALSERVTGAQRSVFLSMGQ